MMTYTETGLALMAAAIEAGTQIQFKRVELVADPERSAGELVHEADIASVKKKDSTTIIVKAVTDNYNFTGDYYFNKINVYVCGTDGQEILFCFQKSTTCPFYIPQYDGRPVQNEISIYITVASADAISIVNDGVYVLQTDFENRMLQKIDVAAIVQNAATRDQTKVASAAVAADLQDQITEQNTNMILENKTVSISAGADYSYVPYKTGYVLAAVHGVTFNGVYATGHANTGNNYAVFYNIASPQQSSIALSLLWVRT